MTKSKLIVLLLLALMLGGCDVSATAVSNDNANHFLVSILCNILFTGETCQVEAGNYPPSDDVPFTSSDDAPFTIWVAEANSGTAMSKVTIDPGSGSMTIAPSPNFPGIHASGITAWLDDPTLPQYGLYLWHDNKVEVLSASGVPVATIAIPGAGTILDVTISPDGKTATVVVSGDTHFFGLDLVGRKSSPPIDLGIAHPRASAALPEGTVTLVTDSSSGKASLVNGGIPLPITITQPTELGKPAATSSGGKFFIPDVTNNGIFLLDSVSRLVTPLSIPGLLDPREILFRGSTAYVLSSPSAGSGPGSLTILDASGNSPQVMTTVALGNQPSGLALSPLGSYQFVANSADGNIMMIDPSGKVTTFRVGAKPVGVVVMH